jgi:DnaK suppressor protein
METFVNSILVPSPDRPRPELLASLPRLRARIQEQRRFRIDQLAALGEPTPRRAGEHDRIRAALAEGARRVLADIETALYRMHTGRYGTCLYCGGPIPLEQLHVIPYATRCVDCQRPASDG